MYEFSIRKYLSFSRSLLVAGCGWFLLTGCASITAHKVAGEPETPTHAVPQRIYVQNFSTPKENLRVDRSGKDLESFQQQIAERLSASLVKQIDHSLAPASIMPDLQKPPQEDAWLITGRFERVAQGSRALRAIFGFGLGGTKIVTTATVYDLSTKKPGRIMTIQTTGGSNAAPGTVINFAPVVVLGPVAIIGPMGMSGILMGGGTGAVPGLGADVKRTAREITAVLSDYCYQKGLIIKDQAMEPKPVGGWKFRFWDPKRPGKTPAAKPTPSPTPKPKNKIGRLTVTPAPTPTPVPTATP